MVIFSASHFLCVGGKPRQRVANLGAFFFLDDTAVAGVICHLQIHLQIEDSFMFFGLQHAGSVRHSKADLTSTCADPVGSSSLGILSSFDQRTIDERPGEE